VQTKPKYALVYYDKNAGQNHILKVRNSLVNVVKFKCTIWEWR
jgi:hypothetical protein